MTTTTRRQTTLSTVTDLVSDFLYYDRKDDKELPRGSIREAVEAGEITEAELVAHFAKTLSEKIGSL